ncbi:MAG: nitrogen regulation protein NR(II) [Candidatus Brocadiales bacterium]
MKRKASHRKPRHPKRKTPVVVTFRVMWVIPLVFALFTLASGYFALNFSKYFFLPPAYPIIGEAEGSLWILLGIYLITALAAFSGAMIARAITKPLKKLSERAEMFAPSNIMKAPDELSLLNKTLEEVFSALDRYMEEGKLLDVLPEGTATIDKSGTITHLNKVAERVLDIKSDQVEGTNFRALFRESPRSKIFLNLIDNALKENSTQVFEDIEVSKKEGYIKLKGRITPKTDDAGKPMGLIITFQDPSEVEHIRNWVKQADQMAGLGTMAAGIAHEIRNPLASIRGLMELIGEDLTETDPKRKYVDAIIKEVDRVNKLVEEVLDFAHTEPSAPEPMHVNDLLKQAINMSKHRMPEKKVTMLEDLGKELPLILARPEKLTQAFENLLVNAIEATPEGGSVRITSTLEDGIQRPALEATRAKRLVVRFFNIGSFIPPEDIERVFLPFFTTKSGGTGLGLPITHRIISAHGGQIKVESNKDTGTIFEIELPTFT